MRLAECLSHQIAFRSAAAGAQWKPFLAMIARALSAGMPTGTAARRRRSHSCPPSAPRVIVVSREHAAVEAQMSTAQRIRMMSELWQVTPKLTCGRPNNCERSERTQPPVGCGAQLTVQALRSQPDQSVRDTRTPLAASRWAWPAESQSRTTTSIVAPASGPSAGSARNSCGAVVVESEKRSVCQLRARQRDERSMIQTESARRLE